MTAPRKPLAVGDRFRAKRPFPGMSAEELEWVVVEVNEGDRVTVDVTWHGVRFARYERVGAGGDGVMWVKQGIEA